MFVLLDDRRRSASPGRSASPSTTELPTRGKTGGAQQSSMQPTKAGDSLHAADREHEHNHHEQEESERGRQQNERHSDDNQQQPGAELMDEDDDLEVEDDGMGDMAAMMGFGGFGSTKGKKIAGNNVGAVRKEKKTEYRQYMNRVGGFNRPLSPSH